MDKRNIWKKSFFCGMSLCLLSMAVTGSVCCAEEMDTETESETEAERETELEILEEFSLGALKISNASGEKAAELYVRSSSEEEWGEDMLADASGFEAGEQQYYDILMVDAQGEELYFYCLLLADMQEVTLAGTAQQAYVLYTEDGQPKDTRDRGLQGLREAKALYTTTKLNVRSLPDTSSDIIGYLDIAEAVETWGSLEGWYLIRYKENYGYVSSKYVTESEEEANQMKATDEQLRAQAEAAAQAAAAQAAAQASSQKQSGGKKGSDKYEVSRESIASCDDPNHGITYITYSDGSVDAIDY